jgi:hypothetical protein
VTGLFFFFFFFFPDYYRFPIAAASQLVPFPNCCRIPIVKAELTYSKANAPSFDEARPSSQSLLLVDLDRQWRREPS